MEITYYGASCLYIATKQTTILVDPDIEAMGLRSPRQKAAVVLYTLQDDERIMPKGALAIDWPGEYEVGNVFIEGIAAKLHIDEPSKPRRGVMYTLNYENKKILITGNIAPDLTDKQFEKIGTIQVLILPVGGHGLTFDAASAAALVTRLEPQIVVPVHYDDGLTKYPVPQDKIEVFLGEIGSESPETLEKLKITSKEESGEESKVILLKPQS